EIDGEPRRVPPEIVDVIVRVALLGDEAHAVPGDGHAEAQDVLREEGGLGLVIPEVPIVEVRKDQERGEEQEPRDRAIRPDTLCGHRRSPTARPRFPPARWSRSRARTLGGRWRAPSRRSARPGESS